MGNTILAHALFSCNQVELDLDNFFSNTGDAHNIQSVNHTDLTAQHLREFPQDDYLCVLEILCDGWYELLRIKMSYSKWIGEVPTRDNYSKFYSYNVNTDKEYIRLWQDFYNSYKDPLWPDCETYQDIINLPLHIQQEINGVYCKPKFCAHNSDDTFVEWLIMCYYDQLIKPFEKFFKDSLVFSLKDYLDGNLDILEETCKRHLNWNWNNSRSNMFVQKMLESNNVYFNWLDKIVNAVNAMINNSTVDAEFELWEQALILAKVCEIKNVHPVSLIWPNRSCNTNTKNIYLNKFKGNTHG